MCVCVYVKRRYLRPVGGVPRVRTLVFETEASVRRSASGAQRVVDVALAAAHALHRPPLHAAPAPQ